MKKAATSSGEIKIRWNLTQFVRKTLSLPLCHFRLACQLRANNRYFRWSFGSACLVPRVLPTLCMNASSLERTNTRCLDNRAAPWSKHWSAAACFARAGGLRLPDPPSLGGLCPPGSCWGAPDPQTPWFLLGRSESIVACPGLARVDLSRFLASLHQPLHRSNCRVIYCVGYLRGAPKRLRAIAEKTRR